MKRNKQQSAPCTTKEQVEKVMNVINESESKELKQMVSDIFILLSKVTNYRNRKCGLPVYRDLVGSHVENIIENLEKCIDEAISAGNDVSYSAIISEARENADAYVLATEESASTSNEEPA